MVVASALTIDRRGTPRGSVIHAALQGVTALNVVDAEILTRAAEVLAEALQQPGVRCLVLSGRDDRTFIGGANLHALRNLDQNSAEPFIRSIHDFCTALRNARVPVIAAMRGYCLGAGLEIAAACDIRVGDRSVRCGMPEVRVGVPSVVEAALLPNLIGWGKARELLFRGNIIDAEEAKAVGLLQHLVDPEILDERVDDIVQDIIAGAPGAIAAQKRLLSKWEDSSLTQAIELGVAALVEAYAGDEPQVYIDRFFEERGKRR
ncbi:MAG: enoyl-CoA hydratase-related protein [Gammaproteobacteria bacterium]|nr:enoyl-CoA hydratase-related protein [Gammaproteobacteria bacterium]